MKKVIPFFIFIAFTFPVIGLAQNQHNIDSLNKVLASKINDTVRVQTKYNLAGEYVFTQPAVALPLLREVLAEARSKKMKRTQAATLQTMGITLCIMRNCDSSEFFMLESKKIYEEIKYKQGIAEVCGALANVHMFKADYDAALKDFKEVIAMNTALGNKKSLMINYINISNIYIDQGNYALALDYLLKGKKMALQQKDERGILKSNNNIGNLFMLQKDYPKALAIYRESEALLKNDDKQDEAIIACNLGIILSNLHDSVAALPYFEKALAARLHLGDKMGLANVYLNFADYYNKTKQPEKALACYQASEKNAQEGNDPYILATAKGMIGQMLNAKKDFGSAKKICTEGLAIAEKIGVNLGMESCLQCLFEANQGSGNYKEALAYHKRYIATRDSFRNLENEKDLFQKTTQFEFEKRAAADSVKNSEQQKVKDAQLAAQHAKLEQKRTQTWFLIGGLVLVLAGLAFVLNRFAVTRRQKKIIEAQKAVVEEQQTKMQIAYQKLHEKTRK